MMVVVVVVGHHLVEQDAAASQRPGSKTRKEGRRWGLQGVIFRDQSAFHWALTQKACLPPNTAGCNEAFSAGSKDASLSG